MHGAKWGSANGHIGTGVYHEPCSYICQIHVDFVHKNKRIIFWGFLNSSHCDGQQYCYI